MKTITLLVEKKDGKISINVNFPELGLDSESLFCAKFRDQLYKFLKELPIATLIGYGSSEDKDEAFKQANIMADIITAGTEPKPEDETN